MNAVEMRTHYALWAIMGAPLILGHDLADFSAGMSREAFLRIVANPEVIAVNQDVSVTVQGRNQTAPRAGGPGAEVWLKPLAGGATAILLLNAAPTNSSLTIRADWAALRLVGGARGARWHLRDVWARKDLGSFTGGYSARVAWHDCVMLKATPATTVEGSA